MEHKIEASPEKYGKKMIKIHVVGLDYPNWQSKLGDDKPDKIVDVRAYIGHNYKETSWERDSTIFHKNS